MHRRLLPTILLTVALVAAACSSGSDDATGPSTTDVDAADTTVSPTTEAPAEPAEPPAKCDPIATSDRCYLPFPNDFFTVPDADTDTGRRVSFNPESMPINDKGVAIDITEQNRSDGFSPGAALLVDLPGVDLAASGVAPITDIESSLAEDAPIVLVDAETGDRHPYWAELDSNVADGEAPLLLVHPATNFLEGHRYAVALRNLVSGDGEPLVPGDNFRLLRDRPDTGDAILEARRPAFEQTMEALVGVERTEVILAWDFTVASARSLSERILHMRDDAFAALGEDAPAFTVAETIEAVDGSLLRTVKGTFEVAQYLTGDGEPGSVFNNGDDASDSPLPEADGTQTANFVCTIPASAIGADGAAVPTRMSLYGHGLLGEATQVEGVGPEYARVSNTTFCATDWIGLASEDVPNAIETLGDLSNFRSMADRMQQGMLNFMFLGRLMKSPAGLTTDPAFQDESGGALLDHENLVLVGLSQGGIMGGAVTAVAQDWDRALLGVPGANYSLLLNRSIDFDTYASILQPAYPAAADRQIGLQLIQMLWDRGENNGYSQHFTKDPYPGTEPKQMLLLEAFGDHQVANISTEVLARTMGAELRAPGLADGRSTDTEPFWGIEPVASLPAEGGSYLVVWDFGTPAPPLTNTPNRGGEDPHGKGRDDENVLTMGATFLESGELIDVCDAGPCATLEDTAG